MSVWFLLMDIQEDPNVKYIFQRPTLIMICEIDGRSLVVEHISPGHICDM